MLHTDLLSRAHTCVWALGRLVALLSWVSALSKPIVRVLFWWRRSLHRTESGTQGRGLESQFGRGPGHPGQESDGLVLLVPGVQAGRVFSGYPAGSIDSQITGRSGTACLRPSTVVRTERGKVKKRKSNCLPPT